MRRFLLLFTLAVTLAACTRPYVDVDPPPPVFEAPPEEVGMNIGTDRNFCFYRDKETGQCQ